MDVCPLGMFVCCQVEVPATVRTLVQMSPIGCGVSFGVIGCNSSLHWVGRKTQEEEIKITYNLFRYTRDPDSCSI